MSDRFKKIVADTKFLIEATDNEQFNLWEKHVDIQKWCPEKAWEQGIGWIETIGYIDNRPVVLTLWPVVIKGVTVCFYECNSQVVDWKMIENFLAENFKGVGTTDAGNFHLCMHFIDEFNKIKANPPSPILEGSFVTKPCNPDHICDGNRGHNAQDCPYNVDICGFVDASYKIGLRGFN